MILDRLHLSDSYSAYVPMLISILTLVPFPYLSSHLFQFHAAATMHMTLLCMILLLLLRYQLGMQPVKVAAGCNVLMSKSDGSALLVGHWGDHICSKRMASHRREP